MVTTLDSHSRSKWLKPGKKKFYPNSFWKNKDKKKGYKFNNFTQASQNPRFGSKKPWRKWKSSKGKKHSQKVKEKPLLSPKQLVEKFSEVSSLMQTRRKSFFVYFAKSLTKKWSRRRHIFITKQILHYWKPYEASLKRRYRPKKRVKIRRKFIPVQSYPYLLKNFNFCSLPRLTAKESYTKEFLLPKPGRIYLTSWFSRNFYKQKNLKVRLDFKFLKKNKLGIIRLNPIFKPKKKPKFNVVSEVNKVIKSGSKRKTILSFLSSPVSAYSTKSSGVRAFSFNFALIKKFWQRRRYGHWKYQVFSSKGFPLKFKSLKSFRKINAKHLLSSAEFNPLGVLGSYKKYLKDFVRLLFFLNNRTKWGLRSRKLFWFKTSSNFSENKLNLSYFPFINHSYKLLHFKKRNNLSPLTKTNSLDELFAVNSMKSPISFLDSNIGVSLSPKFTSSRLKLLKIKSFFNPFVIDLAPADFDLFKFFSKKIYTQLPRIVYKRKKNKPFSKFLRHPKPFVKKRYTILCRVYSWKNMYVSFCYLLFFWYIVFYTRFLAFFNKLIVSVWLNFIYVDKFSQNLLILTSPYPEAFYFGLSTSSFWSSNVFSHHLYGFFSLSFFQRYETSYKGYIFWNIVRTLIGVRFYKRRFSVSRFRKFPLDELGRFKYVRFFKTFKC